MLAVSMNEPSPPPHVAPSCGDSSIDELMVWDRLELQARHANRLQRGLESFSRDWLNSPAALEHPQLSCWIGLRLHAPVPAALDSAALPAGVKALWQGWLQYDAAEFPAAQSLFLQAWEAVAKPGETVWCTEAANAALGLGKTHTRSGHWSSARGWLLHAAAVARCIGDESLCFKAYGALGELLLRAGQASHGFSCLDMAYHLLPAGSGQRARQLNYMGSALRRLGEPLRAESALMMSFHMARDQGDVASQWHALARLQFVALDAQSPVDKTMRLQESLSLDQAAPAVARGFWQLGLARARFQMKPDGAELATVGEQLRDAMQIFANGCLPMEYCWAALWLHRVCGDAEPWLAAREAVLRLMRMPELPPPRCPGVLDETLATLPLATTNGFIELLSLPSDLEQLESLDSLFFI
ncbi:hypothetical protein [uncultured Azohydromonas sp.]|jgi:hypothetical protein|uniref:hypothetical protein n=1 Tax=uncultured Azohydromonas sp. TaxID=487342 RepID=UPI002635171F|nr:hypothetical protein [uncultured Azohydromonas sp.]